MESQDNRPAAWGRGNVWNVSSSPGTPRIQRRDCGDRDEQKSKCASLFSTECMASASEWSPLNPLADEVLNFGVKIFPFTNALRAATFRSLRCDALERRTPIWGGGRARGLQGSPTPHPTTLFGQPNGAKYTPEVFMRTVRISIMEPLVHEPWVGQSIRNIYPNGEDDHWGTRESR